MCLGSPFIVFLNGFGNFSSLLILKNDKSPWFWRSTKVLDSDVNYGNWQRPEYFPNNYKDRSPGASEMLCLERSAKQCSLEILGRVQKDTFHITASFVLKSGFHIVVSVVRMNSICPMNFFSYDRHYRYDRYNDMETRLKSQYCTEWKTINSFL